MTRAQRAAIDAQLREPSVADYGDRSIEQIREGFARFMAGMTVPAGTRSESVDLGGRRALVVSPVDARREGTLLYFHGGANMYGSPETGLAITAGLVVRTGLTAYSLDYRLAPEHPFPTGLDDCVAAYRALLEQGAAPDSIVLAGDSAGGGLCVTTCSKAMDEGLPMPAAVAVFSAGLDYTRTGESVTTKEGIDPLFTRASLDYSGAMYLHGATPDQPLLSPAVVGDLTGFPPLLLQCGGNELMLDDSTRLARRARDAGVDVILDFTADVPHVFQGYVGQLGEADQALDRAALFLTQHVGGDAPRPAVIERAEAARTGS